MKKLIFAIVVGVTALGMSSVSFARGAAPKDFGDVYEGTFGKNTMHYQIIRDANQNEWVVLDRDEAQQMWGNDAFGGHKGHSIK